MAQQAPCEAYMKKFRSLISAPPNIYAELYLMTLYAFMELCQALPLSFSAAPYSLLQRAFSLAVAALQWRRALMMPSHSDSEKIAAQEARWTYALFTTALFRAIPDDWQASYTVGLYKNAQERLDFWHPLMGTLYEPHTFYKIETEPLLNPVEPALLRATWIGRLIPSVALRWLSDSSSPLFPAWWEAITQKISDFDKNPLLQVLCPLAEKLGFVLIEKNSVSILPEPPETLDSTPEITSTSTPQNTVPMISTVAFTSPVHPLPSAETKALIRLTQWLDARQSTLEDRPFIRVETGLFIEETALHRLIAQYATYASIETFLKLLTEFLVPDKNALMVRYRGISVENRAIRQGVVLAEAHLKGWLKALPVCTDFILDYSSFT